LSTVKRQKRKTQVFKVEKIEITGIPAGLAKTRKLIRAEKDKEIQFMKLCSQIRLFDSKQTRSEKQKDMRKAKRQINALR